MIMEMGELWIYQRWTHIPECRYARQSFWVRLANLVGTKSFLKKKIKTQLDTSLNEAQHKQELLCGKIFGSGSIFIRHRSISKSRFNKIKPNSDITPPNNLDMVAFEILLACGFVSTKA
jgi:hypothetical protein